MKAVRFNLSIPKYLAVRTLSRSFTGIGTSPFSCVSMEEVPVPEPVNDQWMKIKTLRSGICGTDLSIINGRTSFSMEPYSSDSFIFGHEIVGEVVEKGDQVKHVREGDRVVVEPTLSCLTRGIQNRCGNCRRGMPHLCLHFTDGHFSPAISIGFNKETGGGWGEYLIAHQSQVYKIPDSLTLNEAVLTEPLSVALHAVLRRYPPNRGTALVIGAGSIGLLTIAALRLLRLRCKIIVVAKYDFQREAAAKMGANVVIDPAAGDFYEAVSKETHARIFKPSLGKRIVEGGVHCVYDTIASSGTVDDALRLTAAGGSVVLIGSAGKTNGADMTPVWFREVDLIGSIMYGWENFRGRKRRTFEMAIEMLSRNKKLSLGSMVTHEFKLDEWKRAIHTAQLRSRSKSIKVAFAMD